jgi:hypothetical protein
MSTGAKLPNFLNNFNSHKYLEGTEDFLNSNSAIAKFAFLLLVIFLFVILLRLGTSIVGLLFSPNPNPTVIHGMIDAKKMIMVTQDPSIKGSIPIMRSVNQSDGIEFTWSVWVHIDDFQYKEGQYKHIFHKGNDTINFVKKPIGLNFPNNAPGLYIAPNTNNLVVIMNTFDKINEEIIIEDIPINKWISVILRCDGNKLDVYINGTLARRHYFSSVPKQNYGNVYVAMNGGFSGYISELRYFDTGIGTTQIQSIVDQGPNLSMKDTDLTKTKPHYLSTKWFFAGNEDAYNP